MAGRWQEPTDRPNVTALPPRPYPTTAAIVLLSLLVHGLQAGALGLYWDDATQLLQPLQAVGHDPIAFILADTGPSLRSERPLAYLAFGLTRLAFLHGVALVHWVLVALLTLNAVAIAAVARRKVNDEWFAFAAAATFLCYPLAPLQPLWAATVHYQVACLLAFTSILCIVRSLTGPVAERRRWGIAGFGAFAVALATHEAFALLAPAFFAARWLVAHAGERRAIGGRIAVFAGLLGLVALWRALVLPAYGLQLYPIAPEWIAPRVLLPKIPGTIAAAALPWKSAVDYLFHSRVSDRWVLAAGAAAAMAAVVSIVLVRGAARTAGSAPGRQWWHALLTGTAMLAAAALAIAVSPLSIEYAFGPSYGSRGNFVALPGIAIVLPALVGLLTDRLGRPLRHAALAGLVFAGSLLHYTVKQGFVRDWEGHKARLATLGALAPGIADSSLVIVLDDRDRRAPYADHYEMSVYLLALYDNWSLLSNTTRHLRFHRDGVESTYHGTAGTWLPPGERGVVAGANLPPVGRIGYDRVLLFRNDRGRLRAVADTVVTTEEGDTLLVRSNTERIRGAPRPAGRTWRHITE
jgi:hypothetical protein